MKVTRIVLGEKSEDTQVVLDDSYVLDGVTAVTIHQEAGKPPSVMLQVEYTGVEIEQFQ